jgi:hypothetical protein
MAVTVSPPLPAETMWPLLTLIAEQSKLYLLLQSSDRNTLPKFVVQKQRNSK